MTEAMTLADFAASPNPLLAGVAKTMRDDSQFMDILTFENPGSLSIKVLRETPPVAVSWRDIGESHGSAINPKPDEITETAYSIGNAIKVDKVYVKDKSARLYNPLTYQTQKTVQSIDRNFTNKCINGLPSDKKNPVGLYHRIMNDLGSSQRKAAGGLDISADATGLAANIQTFLDFLDELLYSVSGSIANGGKGIYLLTNDTVMLRAQAAFRQSGILNQSTDALGRVWTDYKGAKFVDMGYLADDTTAVIGNVEATDGSALTGGGASSIYAVRLGKEYFTGWQEYPMDVSDFEYLEDKVTLQSVIDWVVGIAVSHPRSVSRGYGIVAK